MTPRTGNMFVRFGHVTSPLACLILWTTLAAIGCSQPKPQVKAPAGERTVVIASVPVTPSCQRAVARQSGRAGFALVIQAADVLAPDVISGLDELYRKIHAIRGVLSIQSMTDEQVLVPGDLGVSAEPFMPPEGLDRDGRLARVGQFAGLIDPALLSPDLRVTALIVKLLPTSDENARADIRKRLLELAKTAPAALRVMLSEYPVAARESLTWKTETSVAALKIINESLRGGGVIEIGVACGRDDCLLDPGNLSAIDSLEKSIHSFARVKASWSFVHVLRFANRASGSNSLPESADAALRLLAVMDTSSGIDLHTDKKFRHGTIRVHFTTGNAADYCSLGKALKKASKDASSEKLRFYVKRPGREDF